MSTYNIRKEFLGESRSFREQTMFNPALDEPTYLTFKVDFFSEEYNTDLSYLYDTLPQALFSVGLQLGGQAGDSRNILDIWSNQVDLSSVEKFKAAFKSAHLKSGSFSQDRPYSALEYLFSRNEDYRCYLLANFLKGWNELQNNYQYYFQEISGLEELFKSSPSKGQKIEKNHTISIKCLEGIDQKVKALLSLYKAAAWDDHYQRWILPDIYRYFKMDIYISEIRTFHQSVYAEALDPNGRYSKSFAPGLYSSNGSFAQAIDRFAGNIVDTITGKVFSKIDEWTEGGVNLNRNQDNFILGAVKGFVPVTCLRCSLCDFDIDYNPYQSSYTVNNDQMETTEIRVRVRQVEEIHNWRIIEPYKNLINADERTIGQSSLAVITRIGQDADQYFNGLINMSDGDKSRSFTDMISSGFIVDAIKDIAKSLTDPSNGVLDTAYDIYSAVRGASATKDAIAEDYLKFTAANGTISEIGNLRDNSNKRRVQDTSLDPHAPYGNAIWDVPDLFDRMDASVYSYIVSLSNNLELNGGIIDDTLQYNGLISIDGGGSPGMVYIPQGDENTEEMTPVALTSVPQRVMVDSILGGTMTYGELYSFFHPNLQTVDSSSLATEKEDRDLQYVRIQVPEELENSQEEESLTSIQQPEDRSIATSLDNEDDWTWKEQSSMTKIDSSIEKSIATSKIEAVQEPMTWVIDILNDGELYSEIYDTTYWAGYKIEDASTKSFATGEGFDSNYTNNARALMQEVKDSSEDRSLATNLDNQLYWDAYQASLMQKVEDVSTKSLATSEGDNNINNYIEVFIQDDKVYFNPELDSSTYWEGYKIQDVSTKSFATSEGFDNNYLNIIRGLMQSITNDDQDRSLTTELDNPWWWVIDQRNAMTFNRPEDDDRSLATDLDNIFTWELINRDAMPWISQGNDRSLATHFDNLWDWEQRVKAQMEEITAINDRSWSTSFDNYWHWDADHQDYMTWMTTDGMDRSQATDLDNKFDWEEDEVRKIENLTKLQAETDRSLATELDNLGDWPPKMEPGFVKPATVEDRSLATDLDSVPSLESINQVKTDIIASQTEDVDERSDDVKRDGMTWVNQETSIFENIANMQSLTQPEETNKVPNIQVTLIDNSSKPESLLDEDLFTKIAESVNSFSTATSQSTIELSYQNNDQDRSLATDLDTAPTINTDNVSMIDNSPNNTQMLMPNGNINPDVPVRDLIEVYLIDRGKLQETIQDVKLVSVDDKRTKTIL